MTPPAFDVNICLWPNSILLGLKESDKSVPYSTYSEGVQNIFYCIGVGRFCDSGDEIRRGTKHRGNNY